MIIAGLIIYIAVVSGIAVSFTFAIAKWSEKRNCNIIIGIDIQKDNYQFAGSYVPDLRD